ncbi:MAG: hypothetical protein AVDCRST_MAG06-2923, partial [uncultured Nocardioides sp.]
ARLHRGVRTLHPAVHRPPAGAGLEPRGRAGGRGPPAAGGAPGPGGRGLRRRTVAQPAGVGPRDVVHLAARGRGRPRRARVVRRRTGARHAIPRRLDVQVGPRPPGGPGGPGGCPDAGRPRGRARPRPLRQRVRRHHGRGPPHHDLGRRLGRGPPRPREPGLAAPGMLRRTGGLPRAAGLGAAGGGTRDALRLLHRRLAGPGLGARARDRARVRRRPDPALARPGLHPRRRHGGRRRRGGPGRGRPGRHGAGLGEGRPAGRRGAQRHGRAAARPGLGRGGRAAGVPLPGGGAPAEQHHHPRRLRLPLVADGRRGSPGHRRRQPWPAGRGRPAYGLGRGQDLPVALRRPLGRPPAPRPQLPRAARPPRRRGDLRDPARRTSRQTEGEAPM